MQEKVRVSKTVGKGGEDYKRRKEQESELRRTVTALKRIEDRISAIDGELAAADSRLSDPGVSADYEQVLELTGLIDSLNDEQTRLMSEWEKLENRKSELEELLKI